MSLNETLQLSLISLKERCLKQQKRIEDFERENDRLRLVIARNSSLSGDSGRETSASEIIRQLEEANIHLRQRNLELTQDLLKKDSSLKTFQREPFPSIKSFEGGCMDEEFQQDELEDDSDVTETLERLNFTGENLNELKSVLLDQQKALVALIDKAGQQKNLKCESQHQRDTPTKRLCPMCENQFPEDKVSDEEFESHVMDHFSYDDSSLENYSMMLDANTRLVNEFG